MLKRIKDDVLGRERTLEYRKKEDGPPFKVTWVATFSPATPNIEKIISKANDALSLSDTWKGEKRPIGLVHKRALNLGNRTFKRRRFALSAHDSVSQSLGTVRCTEESASQRGRKCKGCPMMSSKSCIISTSTKKKFNLPSATCKSKFVIYAAQCRKCSIQYTGRTVQELRSRISGHRGWMNKTKSQNSDKETKHDDEDEGALAEHLKTAHGLNTTDDFDSTYQFTVLQLCEPGTLVNCESDWIRNLKTLTPFGLNISKPYGMKENLI